VTREQKYIVFNTNMGWVGILSSAKGLVCITLPQPSAQEARQLLGAAVDSAAWSPEFFDDLTERFKAYFSGKKIIFTDKLDLSTATLFQRRVWESTRLIPFGKTKSYGWVAEQIDKPKAARAVGQALVKNPLPIIVPCHRVLTSDGKLGGFTGGVEIKQRLLGLEASAS
jgi:methylated-DNA-[protein]-cysteine S-methyltransferase